MENIVDDLNYRGLIEQYSNEENVRKLLSKPLSIAASIQAPLLCTLATTS